MPFIALGALILLVLVWVGRGRSIFQRRDWRITSGAFALAALAGAAYSAIREAWAPALGLLAMSAWLAVSARRTASKRPTAPRSSQMSSQEARSILGVEDGATPAEIRAAHKRLMLLAHPDTGGTSGLAAQLNAARDLLLRDD